MPGMPQPQMTWQDITRAVVKANPGAAPDVVASAVSKALPLMNAQSQQEWKQVQLMLQQERLNLTAERDANTAASRSRGLDVREDALRETERYHRGLEEHRKFLEDAKATQIRQRADEALSRATNFKTMQDFKVREAALNDYFKAKKEEDTYLRNKIATESNIAGPDKAKMLKELDDAYVETKQRIEILKQQLEEDKAGNPDAGPKGGTGKPAAAAPGTKSESRVPAASAGITLSPEEVAKLKKDIADNPHFKDQIVKSYKDKGYTVPEGL